VQQNLPRKRHARGLKNTNRCFGDEESRLPLSWARVLEKSKDVDFTVNAFGE
jgi:hypothetical protein